MFKTIKTLGTILTVVSTAQFGKEMYDNYKDKKRKRQIDEVHQFISNLNLTELQDAIKSENTEKLIDAVEAIMTAAENVKIKSDLDELKDDITSTAKKVFSKVSDVAEKVVASTSKKIDEINTKNENKSQPTFKQFLDGAELEFNTPDRVIIVTINNAQVFVNVAKKTVTLFDQTITLK